MRPTRISMSAFGPFAGEISVDLEALGREGLYLIHGPTGAGKSSLLDAMCFALYGRIPRHRGARSGASAEDIRSQHADPGAETWAELELWVDGSRYAVRRSPPYERPRKRGPGTTTQQASAQLVMAEGDHWKPVARGTDEVNRAVRDLLGLDAEQFSQVILLPQGRFAEVLQAGSGERESLLRTLFDTDLFAAVERWLDDRTRSATAELEAADRELQQLRRRAADRFAELSCDELGSRPDGAPGDQAALDALVDRLDRGHQEAVLRLLAAKDRLERTGSALRDAEALARRWDERARLRAELDELGRDSDRISVLRARIELADRAEPVLPTVHRAESAAAARRDSARAAEGARRRVSGLLAGMPEGVLASAGTHTEAMEGIASVAGLDGLRTEIADRRAALLALARSQSRLVELREAASRAARQAKDAETQAGRHRSALEQAQERLTSCRADLESAREASAQLAGLESEHRHLTQRAEAARELAVVTERLERAADRCRRVVDRHQEAVDRFQTAQRLRFEHMAGVLAAELSPGDPCAVCGSPEHPAPATLSASVVDDAQLEQLGAHVDRARTEREDVEHEVAELREAHAALAERAGPAPKRDRLDAELVGLRGHLDQVRALAGTAASLSEQVDELTGQIHQMTEALAAAESSRSEHAALAVTSAEQADSLAREMAETLGSDSTDLDSAIAALSELDRAAAEALEALRVDAARAAAFQEAEERLAEDLTRYGFTDAAQAKTAALTEADRTAAALAVQHHDTRSAELAALLASEHLAGLPDERPDLEPITAAAIAAQEDHRAAVAEATEWGAAKQAVGEWAEEHRKLAAGVAARRERASHLRRLHSTVCGTTGERVSLSRWVLAAYLSDICVLANQRLTAMTAGRYSLRVMPEGGHANRRGGLDLRVLDTHTGAERKVSSLSGGETFQASLALALAVADAVQQHCGGLRMDALFVDEGFGSLDQDALELAMDTLDELRAGGRSIGVISHVGSMKERIRTGIEVIPSERGSSVRVGPVNP